MASYKKIIPFIKSWEGGYVNHPLDKGGPTNQGITLKTYKSAYGKNKDVKDLQALTAREWEYIFVNLFWNTCQADRVISNAVAYLLVDFAWASGANVAIRKLQKVVNAPIDGIMGPITLAAVNSKKPELVFRLFHTERTKYIMNIVKNTPSQQVFLSGWLRRNNSIKYYTLECNGGETINITAYDYK